MRETVATGQPESDADRGLRSKRPKLHVVEASGGKSAIRSGRWPSLLGVLFGTHILALADQVVVSGTALLSTVMVGRWTTPSEFGVFMIGLSILGSLLAAQDALVLLPYMIQRHRPSRRPAEHAGMLLLHSNMLAAAFATALALAGAGALAFWPDAHLTWVIWALVLTVPFAMLRELGRNYAFSHLNVANALVLDAAVAALQLGILV